MTTSLVSGARQTSVQANRDSYYKEDNLIKRAATFASNHTDVGPLNNMFSSKIMIKNKLNQVKFPNAYQRDGNDLLQPKNYCQVQPLELRQLTQMVTTNDDYQSTLHNLKMHQHARVMLANQVPSDVLREKIVSSGSARDNIDSQGLTGVLQIIDQSSHKSPKGAANNSHYLYVNEIQKP